MNQNVARHGWAAELTTAVAGAVHLPGTAGYDEGRRTLFPLDPRPVAVAEATCAADVVAAVNTARAYGLPFAVQATGHGTRLASDGALLLKTTGMTSVLVDPDRRIAQVGPGAVWGQVLAAAAPFGLAGLSGSHQTVGVTGYTLGGGMGWLGRRFGYAADSVVRAEVVLADGRLVTANADQHPDLFWALRGGGGSFGVVTSLEFRLHEVPSVYAGTACFPIENAAETLRRYRAWAAEAPDAMSTAVLLTRLPDAPNVPAPVRGRRVLAIKAMYAGGAEEARRVLRPLWDAAGPALHEDLHSSPYAEAEMGGVGPRHLDFYRALPDGVIDLLVRAAGHDGAPVATVEVRHYGGAIARAGAAAGPAGHRDAPFGIILDTEAPEIAAALGGYGIGGTFLNFLGDPSKTATAFTAGNHRRLREIKAAYDPANLFQINNNIAPAEERVLVSAH